MKKLQCEVCGSTDIKKTSEDSFECQSCGVKYSKNDVQALLVEINGPETTVKSAPVIQKETDPGTALRLADDAFSAGNYDKAYSYYTIVLNSENNNAYVTFMIGLCSAWQSTLTKENSEELFESSRKAEEMINTGKSREGDKCEFMVWMAERITEFALSYQRSATAITKGHIGSKALIEETWKGLIVSLNCLQFASILINEDAIAKIKRAEDTKKRIALQGNYIINQLLEKREFKEHDSVHKLAPSVEVKKIADYYSNYFDTCIFNLPSSVEMRRKSEERESTKKNYWQEHPEEYKAHLERKKKAEAKKRKNKIISILFIISFVVAAIGFFWTYYIYSSMLLRHAHLALGVYLLIAGGIYFVLWLRKYLATMNEKK